MHGASVPQPVATGRAFSPRLFGVVVILRNPDALKERPSSRFRGISLPSKSRRLRYSTVSLTRYRSWPTGPVQ
ncbi:hypothetical protein [Hafnia alvei]|uniref:hypothetical protein n=1 Tax=Hafnia alvei TaxID=569 RepID=UPI0038BA1A01